MIRFVLSLLICCTVVATAQNEGPDTHNMVVFGDENIYISHLPMFMDSHPQHHYQAIFRVSFGEQGNALYRKEWKKSKRPVFGISPEEFTMPSLLERKEPFSAILFLHHPEANVRPGEFPSFRVNITIEEVVHFHRFTSDAKRPQQLEYFLAPAGSANRFYFIHRLTTPTRTMNPQVKDQFDQIVLGTLHSNDSLQIKPGDKVAFPKLPDTYSSRLQRESVARDGVLLTNLGPLPKAKVQITVEDEGYVQTGMDVRVPQ